MIDLKTGGANCIWREGVVCRGRAGRVVGSLTPAPDRAACRVVRHGSPALGRTAGVGRTGTSRGRRPGNRGGGGGGGLTDHRSIQGRWTGGEGVWRTDQSRLDGGESGLLTIQMTLDVGPEDGGPPSCRTPRRPRVPLNCSWCEDGLRFRHGVNTPNYATGCGPPPTPRFKKRWRAPNPCNFRLTNLWQAEILDILCFG